MRFVAGRGAVAESHRESAAGLGAVAESHRESAAAAAPWRSCCRQGTVGTEDSLPEHRSGAPSGRACRSTEDDAAASGSQQAHRKREGPGRDLNISPEPLLFIALRKGYTPCDEAEPPFTACMQCWHALQAKLPLQLCRDCKEGCSKCKNCVELWEYGKDKGVTEYILSV